MNLHDKLIKTFSNKFHFIPLNGCLATFYTCGINVIIPWIDFYTCMPKKKKHDKFYSALIIPSYLVLCSPLKHSKAAQSEVDFFLLI